MHLDGQQTCEKMLNIIHQGNTNQNHNEISLHTCQNGYKSKKTNKCWKLCGKEGTHVHCWGDILIGIATRENRIEAPQKINT